MNHGANFIPLFYMLNFFLTTSLSGGGGGGGGGGNPYNGLSAVGRRDAVFFCRYVKWLPFSIEGIFKGYLSSHKW